jgi:gas vesicle protein
MYNARQQDFFWGALVGGTVATLTTLLFATEKGKKIQHKIAETYGNLEDSVKEGLSKAEDVAENMGKKVSSAFNSEDDSCDSCDES